MMTSTAEVTNEIKRLVLDKVNNGVIVHPDWLTTEIMNMKSGFEGDDSDFYIVCARQWIWSTVRSMIPKYAPKEGDGEQITMEGFDHLQKAYPVKREKQIMLVPVAMLTDSELEERALEYEAMARGCLGHAMDIRRYISERANEKSVRA